MFVVGGGNYIEYQNLVDYAKVLQYCNTAILLVLLQDTVIEQVLLLLLNLQSGSSLLQKGVLKNIKCCRLF